MAGVSPDSDKKEKAPARKKRDGDREQAPPGSGGLIQDRMAPPLEHHVTWDSAGAPSGEQCAVTENTKRLWAAVIKQALKDAGSGDPVVQAEARAWFFSDIQGIGSFAWICAILDFDPGSIQSILRRQLF